MEPSSSREPGSVGVSGESRLISNNQKCRGKEGEGKERGGKEVGSEMEEI